MITEYRIGERIKELRKKNGWTQEQVADKIGVTKSVVSFYERNNRTPSPEMLVKFAQLYDVSADYLLGIAKVDDNHLDVTGLSRTEKHALQSIVDALRRKSN